MRIQFTGRGGVAALAAAVAMAAAATGTLAQKPPPTAGADAIKIPFETYTLPNGLTVITSLDRTTPTVAVNVWYHVGSKNEAPGRTGFAHLFEHVMFTGSGNVPYGTHDRLTEGVGGSNNGTTSNDRTTYYETVPTNYLESALWLEADRMGFLLDALDLAKLNAQRDIVKNERRQSVDNQPYGRAGEILSSATYPAAHPYSWSVIGSMADLSAATEEDVKSFFRLYYAPNNAYLAIVGDFDPAQVKSWVQKYFGDIPRGTPDLQAEGGAGDAGGADSGSSTRTRSRFRASTSSGRRWARSIPTASRSKCSGRSCPERGRHGSPRRSSTTSSQRPPCPRFRGPTKTWASS